MTSFLILNLQVLEEKSDQMQLTMLQKHFMAREMAFKMHHIAPSATVSSGRLPQLMSKLKPNCMTLRRNCNIPTLHALTEAQSATYQGRYGDFTIGPSDEQEVLLYRAGINVSAMSSALASFSAFFPSDQPPLDLNALTLLFSGGLLVSLLQIHIYLDPLKKMLQALWAVGFAGILFLMLSQPDSSSVPAFVVSNPSAVWLVGPMFAALTGVAFKEGLCYGKAEAAGLFGATPILLLGHLSSALDAKAELGLLASFEILFVIFALRKWTQPVKDDVGDKSVFEFLRRSAEEQEARDE